MNDDTRCLVDNCNVPVLIENGERQVLGRYVGGFGGRQVYVNLVTLFDASTWLGDASVQPNMTIGDMSVDLGAGGGAQAIGEKKIQPLPMLAFGDRKSDLCGTTGHGLPVCRQEGCADARGDYCQLIVLNSPDVQYQVLLGDARNDRRGAVSESLFQMLDGTMVRDDGDGPGG